MFFKKFYTKLVKKKNNRHIVSLLIYTESFIKNKRARWSNVVLRVTSIIYLRERGKVLFHASFSLDAPKSCELSARSGEMARIIYVR